MERFATGFDVVKHSCLEYPLDYFSLTNQLYVIQETKSMVNLLKVLEKIMFKTLSKYGIISWFLNYKN